MGVELKYFSIIVVISTTCQQGVVVILYYDTVHLNHQRND